MRCHFLSNCGPNMFRRCDMWSFPSFVDSDSPRTPRRPRSRATASRRPRRPHMGVQSLEDRTVPATIPVTTFADVVDLNDGLTSLREAIALAADPATHAGDDTIVLPHEIGGAAGTYALSPGLLIINDATGKLTILSDGGPATIDARGANRVFHVPTGSEAVSQGLTITGGSDLYGGGGIFNLGTATIADSTLSGNSAFYYGGGIFNSGTLTLTNSTLSGNSAGYGGGITNYSGTLTVTASALSDNMADYGGGVANFDSATITISTLSRNKTAYHDGGGIWNYGTATLTVSASTLSDNSAAFGGGIYNHGTA